METYRCFSRPSDLVITNTRVPRMDGFEVIRRIRELRPEQPIIQITGHPGPAGLGVGVIASERRLYAVGGRNASTVLATNERYTP